MPRPRLVLTRDALADRCVPEPNTGCWLFLGSAARGGYPKVKTGGRTYLAHRIMYELVFGPIPAGLNVLHYCDTPACMNPGHFWLGTIAENNADRARKGRGARDFRNGKCRQGHDLAVAGVYVCAGGKRGRKRVCRICNLNGQRRRRRARQSA